jgi:hypothetical protein
MSLDFATGASMIDLYSANTSNGQRAAIILEECALTWRLHKLDVMKAEQRQPEFLAINPAGAIPFIVDSDGPGGMPITLAQSCAIIRENRQVLYKLCGQALAAVTDAGRHRRRRRLPTSSTTVHRKPTASSSSIAWSAVSATATGSWPADISPANCRWRLRSIRSMRCARRSSTLPLPASRAGRADGNPPGVRPQALQ